MCKSFLTFILFALFSLHSLFAQFSPDTLCRDWTPRVKGNGPVRGFEVSYHANADFDVSSESDVYGNGEGKIDHNRIFKTKIRFPLYLNEKLKIAGSFEYSDEEIHFRDIESNNYPLYRSLHEKNMKSIGGSLYLMTQVKRNMYFILRFNGKLRGDYWKEHIGNVSKYTFLKMEIAPIIGWKVNQYKSWGVGFAFSYTFGDPLVFPIITYNHTFAEKWGVEAFLPAKLKLRYNLSDLCIFYAKARLKGGSYSIHFDDPALNDFKTLELRRSDVNFSFKIDKGITDWLWLAFEGGYRANINFDVTNKNHTLSLSGSKITHENNIIDSYAKGGMFYNVSLFIVPSKTILKRIGIK